MDPIHSGLLCLWLIVMKDFHNRTSRIAWSSLYVLDINNIGVWCLKVHETRGALKLS